MAGKLLMTLECTQPATLCSTSPLTMVSASALVMSALNMPGLSMLAGCLDQVGPQEVLAHSELRQHRRRLPQQ